MTKFSAAKIAILLTTVCLPAVAKAQLTSTVGGVQTRIAADPNGVDLVTGTFNYERTDLTFGPNAMSRLALKTQRGSGDGDNYRGQVYDRTEGGLTYVYLTQGKATEKFLYSGGVYSSVSGNGATLSKPTSTTYLLTRSDGTQIEYFYTHYSYSGFYTGSGSITYINYILYPDGEKLTLTQKQEYMTWCEEPDDPDWPDRGAAKPGKAKASTDASAPPSDPQRAPPMRCWKQPVTRLQSITSNLGLQIRYTYAAEAPVPGEDHSGGFFVVTSAKAVNLGIDYCDPASSTCSYSRTWPGLTYSTTAGPNDVVYSDAMGHGWALKQGGDLSGNVTISLYRPSSTTPYIVATIPPTFGAGVSSVQTPAGTWNYSYSDLGTVRTTIVTDPLSQTRTVISDLTTGLVTSDTNALGQTTSYQYDSNGRVTRVTYPELNYTAFTYDARGNVTVTRQVSKTPGTPADIVTTAYYPSSCSNVLTCNQPEYTLDALGNRTDYTYDASHGGTLAVTAPAATTGAARPETRYSYTALYAYYKNSGGTIVAAPSPVYRLTGTSACSSGSSCTGERHHRARL